MQKWIIGLLLVIAILLGVVISLMVRPSAPVGGPANEIAVDAANQTEGAGEAPAPATAGEGDPIDAAVNGVLAEADAPTEVKVATIPRPFWGVWTRSPELCGQPDGDDSAIEISARALRFWESSAVVSSVALRGPLEVEISGAFSGEGETWDATGVYTLSPTRQELRVSEGGRKALVYRRCPVAG